MFHLWELFLFIVQFSVEGAWTTWDNWGACSGTCNTNTRTRSMLYSGNLPCTGTSSETGNCQSEEYSLSLFLMALSCFYQFSVEGSWTAWGSFGSCSITCGTSGGGTQSKTRSYTGNRPCSSTDTYTQSCNGKQSKQLWNSQRSSYSLYPYPIFLCNFSWVLDILGILGIMLGDLQYKHLDSFNAL